jgi:hypothetical protein
MAHAWKVCVRQRTEGSNPSLSANTNVAMPYFTRAYKLQASSTVLPTVL